MNLNATARRAGTKRLASLAAALSLALAAHAAPVSSLDSLGRAVTLAAPAARVVSLSPVATETLFAVGAGAAVVGDTSYCDYPEAALALPKIGGFSAKSISVERIVALKPDLVVSGGKIHASVEEALAKLGVPCFAYSPGDFAGVARTIDALGDLVGRPAEARKASAAMLAEIARIGGVLAKAPASARPSVFWEVYDEPLMTCGSSTFQHAIVVAAGGADIFSDLPGSWPRVSAEEVIRRAPDFIMGADDHGDKMSVAQIAARPGWGGLEAVRRGRVALVPANLVSRPGPRLAEGVLAVAKILHPELKF